MTTDVQEQCMSFGLSSYLFTGCQGAGQSKAIEAAEAGSRPAPQVFLLAYWQPQPGGEGTGQGLPPAPQGLLPTSSSPAASSSPTQQAPLGRQVEVQGIM